MVLWWLNGLIYRLIVARLRLLRYGSLLSCCLQKLGRHTFYFRLEGIKYILDNLLIVREISLQPLECLSLIAIPASIYKSLEFFKLLICHLIGKLRANP